MPDRFKHSRLLSDRNFNSKRKIAVSKVETRMSGGEKIIQMIHLQKRMFDSIYDQHVTWPVLFLGGQR
jgi:hypothetical protein